MTLAHDIAFLPIAELGRRYRTGELSPVVVTQLCLDRAIAFEPRLNAIATLLPGAALAAARLAEAELGRGIDRGPLHGVPVMIKDLFAMTDAPTRFGAHPVFCEHPTADAALVARLREAGAILLAKTNMLEFAYGAVHPQVGQTSNPHDPSRTSGGSSGGSAASVAAGTCYAAVGTDTGGSIRIPAAYCGIVGLKPSHGLVDMAGGLPLSWSLDHAGPLARNAADAALMLGAMTGRRFAQPLPELRGLRLGVIPAERGAACVTIDVRGAFARACDHLMRAGVTIEEVDVPELHLASEALMLVLTPEAAAIHAQRLARQPEAFAPMTRLQIEAGFAVPAVAYVRAQQFRARLQAAFARVFQIVDALLSPAVPYVAPIEDPPMDEGGGSDEMLFSAPANLTGLPAVALPGGIDAAGLPIGQQLTAGAGRDGFLLALAEAVGGVLGPTALPAMARA